MRIGSQTNNKAQLAACTPAGQLDNDFLYNAFDLNSRVANDLLITPTGHILALAQGSIVLGRFLGSNITLPVTLLSFAVTSQANGHLLNWNFATQENLSHFEIEQSYNGREFKYLGRVDATQAHAYSFLNNQLLNGINFYRLKTTDLNGSFEYSNIVSVTVSGVKAVNIFPNPVVTMMELQSVDILSGIKIFDDNGRLIHQQAANTNQLLLPVV